MNKRVGVIGHVGHGKSTLSAAVEAAEAIRFNSESETLIVNGNEYREVEQTHTKRSKLHTMAGLIMGMIAMGGMGESKRSRSRRYPEVDIVREFALIEQKKSDLSRSEREHVISEFNKRFKKVPNGK